WNIISMQHFVNRQPKNISIYRRDAMQFPVFCMFLDDGIGFIAVFERAFDERISNEANGSLLHRGGRQCHFLTPGSCALLFGDGRRALGIPELSQSRVQIRRRIEIMLKQELNGALARLASFSHNLNHAAEMPWDKRKISNPNGNGS